MSTNHRVSETSKLTITQINTQNVNRSSGANWKQQKMQAWQPVIRPKPVIFTFLVVGIALISIGIAMYISINNVMPFEFIDNLIDYFAFFVDQRDCC